MFPENVGKKTLICSDKFKIMRKVGKNKLNIKCLDLDNKTMATCRKITYMFHKFLTHIVHH